jgi:high-affinity Fe2+/Pb2+ permease
VNPRHTTAVLLIAFGAFAVLVGSIGGTVGIAQWASSETKVDADFLFGWLACTGGLPLLLGGVLLPAGVHIYRTSDHRLEEVRDKQGRVVGRRLPVLSPLWLVTFALISLLGIVLFVEGAFDTSSPKTVVVALRYGLLVCVIVSALVAWAYRRVKGPPDDAVAKKDETEGTKPAE